MINSILKNILVIIIFLFPIHVEGQEQWKLVKYAHGIEVYSSFPKKSKLKHIKIVTTVESRLTTVVALLKDIPRFPDWIYACKRSWLVEYVSATEDYYYTETDAPWPISNRDAIMHSVLQQDPETKIVTSVSNGVPDKIETYDDIVRVHDIHISWTLIPKKSNRVKIIYKLVVDPAGRIPLWLANLTMEVGPYYTMKRMKEELSGEKYKNVNYDFIVD